MFAWIRNFLKREEPVWQNPQKIAQELTIVVSDAETVARLKKRGGHRDNIDLINTALTMYTWALDAINEGRVIGSINERDDSYRELSMPSFDRLKEQIPWGTWVDLDEEVCECGESDDGKTL